jgi:HEAT repeat protein
MEEIEPDLLADALYALGNTYNKQYVPIFIKFENHHNQFVRDNAKEALIELSKR